MNEKFIEFNEKRGRALTERYVLHVFNVFTPTQPKLKLGYKQPKICRYCGEDEGSTTFREESHAVPIFLGNKTIIDELECDRCNHHFGDHLENNFAAYTHPHRPLQRIRGRNGIPKYKALDLEISAVDQSNLVIYVDCEGGIDTLEVEGKNQLRLQMMRQPYYPTAIHKMLIKMALAMMPDDDHCQFNYLKPWLLSKDHKPGLSGTVPVIEWGISGGVNPNRITCIVAKVREAFKDSTYGYQFIFQYGNFQYQLVIPLPEECGHRKEFVYAPVFLPDEHFRVFGPSDFQEKHFNSPDRVRGEKLSILLQYSGISSDGPRQERGTD
ncbi:HNH endonuclease [Pseudomonas putida]|uniref:HNH endonuclease n=1 Tax=Pseudomonas putida TaxID=303 RepID=A0AAW5HNG7_PSEPU|nr:HNH endonuclease [Pseudomonas putida]MCO1623701.1 HNH endonuclease [Pseudomonas putida]